MPLLVLDQRSPEWHAARAGKLTASLAAACLGLDPWKGTLAAFNQITGKTVQADNRDLSWGREFEGDCRNEYEAVSGLLVQETGFWISPTLPWLGASPDGLVEDDGLVELKVPREIPVEVPAHYEIQCRVQLAVTERAWCDFFAWNHGEICLVRIHRDMEREEYLLKTLANFYQTFIVPGKAPPRKRKEPA